MSNLAGIIVSGVIVIVLVIVLALRNGPIVAEGWEDENGFHYGEHP